MGNIHIGSLEVSRFILGGNPFSGFSHQSPEMNSKMLRYFSVAQIKRLLRDAEALGGHVRPSAVDLRQIQQEPARAGCQREGLDDSYPGRLFAAL